jgi:hypothetical protein
MRLAATVCTIAACCLLTSSGWAQEKGNDEKTNPPMNAGTNSADGKEASDQKDAKSDKRVGSDAIHALGNLQGADVKAHGGFGTASSTLAIAKLELLEGEDGAADAAKEVLRGESRSVGVCARNALSKDVDKAELTMLVTIGESGAVSKAAPKGTEEHAQKWADCTAEQIEKYEFTDNKAGDKFSVTYKWKRLKSLKLGSMGLGTAGRTNKSDSKNEEQEPQSDALPQVIPGKPNVNGALDKQIIRRVILLHRREVSSCYEQGVRQKPDLHGRIKTKFVISGTGKVTSAMISSSTLKDRDVEKCITNKIKRWVFPEPKGGGIVVVNYPFTFQVR